MLVWVLLVLGTGQALGQGFMQDSRERIEAMRVAYITRRLQLTADESQKFWPVYNEYTAELQKNNRDKQMEMFETRLNFDSMAEAELDKQMMQIIDLQAQEVEIIRKFHGRFKQVLSIKKVAMLYRAEREFKRELIRQLSGMPNRKPGN